MQLILIAAAGVCVFTLMVFLFGPVGMPKGKKLFSDYLLLVLIGPHAIWVLAATKSNRRTLHPLLFRIPEVLFMATLILFLFSYLFASNANMDYVQRFALTSGSLRFAPDSRIQRLNSWLQHGPFLLFDLFVLCFFRIKKYPLCRRVLGIPDSADKRFTVACSAKSGVIVPGSAISAFTAVWGLFLALLSAFLYAIALPSFINLNGVPILAYACLVPLFLVFYSVPYGWGVFYGVSFGVIQTMLTNYWLATFSLVSLQFITVCYLFAYAIFMTVTLYFFKRAEKQRWNWNFMIFPAAWVFFDFLRSSGFLGYPWAMLGTSQYTFLPLIQVASLTGVWGVSYILLLANSSIAEILARVLKKTKTPVLPACMFGGIFLFTLVYGITVIHLTNDEPVEKTVRAALIQQNTDPRKDDYRKELDRLKYLTDQALRENPAIIAWSETAFVPNVRRWSTQDPDTYYLARLVKEFLAYQKSIKTWLITGNDDYELSMENGEEKRLDYNAAILFSDRGERVKTYHKIHLVPFTEYFPFKKELPWLYQLLLTFDVNLWEPGTERVVFKHPSFTFSTPICFEDCFPDDIRRFVLAGAEVILNLSNDYWSLTKVEGKQHYINSLFRAVENRRALLRATASGLTAYVDVTGKLIKSSPFYEEAFIIAAVEVRKPNVTFYTRYGDWFPQAAGLFFILTAGYYLILSMLVVIKPH
ncbi:MAG: apolipoprotein N-acyltransferase [Spirochaetota bacterium]